MKKYSINNIVPITDPVERIYVIKESFCEVCGQSYGDHASWCRFYASSLPSPKSNIIKAKDLNDREEELKGWLRDRIDILDNVIDDLSEISGDDNIFYELAFKEVIKFINEIEKKVGA